MTRIAGHEIGNKATARPPTGMRGEAKNIARLVKEVRTRKPNQTDDVLDQQLSELGRVIRRNKSLAGLTDLSEGQALVASLKERAESLRQRLPILEARRSARAQSVAIEIILLDGIAYELALLSKEHKRATRFFGIAEKLRRKRRPKGEEVDHAEG